MHNKLRYNFIIYPVLDLDIMDSVIVDVGLIIYSFFYIKEEKEDMMIVDVKQSYGPELLRNGLGPELEMVPRLTVIADFYAGLGFFSLPPPRSLPLPTFFKMKSEDNLEATSELRCLLRLYLVDYLNGYGMFQYDD
ncbi:hypothetical protein MTR67_039323 [Solanum verrucosum]|uniref:Uncharacterized protein n=1 Tax=Solanum verrucosum TaxID=315347 RepID=A0AAF0UGQ3_SOLVR|nr:hypothetical protein MTR67_039323 [Solanum verrucosum]